MKKILITVVIIGMFGWAVYDLTSSTSSSTSEDNNEEGKEFNVAEGKGSDSNTTKVGLEVGKKAPDFQLTTLNDKKISLSNLKGEKVMINFWATWCPPCRAEMPDMEKFYQNKDITILAINLTSTESGLGDVRDFVKEFDLSFPILLDNQNNIATSYQIRPIPTTYMVNSNGVIQHKALGAMNYEQMIKQYEQMN
ncbi:alkyl hydroperoxide reductase [Pontibacillus yanchengensis Y32]|uniref:Alkyl hydroperoxide reductase n=1 Tax=Pontibacillus yanchengensis Y32 TaxID=1385514 RepID=A0A0A2TPH7_9BACI|nr:TlpA disulfide reductase family protein [Pontibacillus yanchengensis]KGP71235.1 alkyl hydroperoxide reductase [Pontibacillus yanchengensis Y32]